MNAPEIISDDAVTERSAKLARRVFLHALEDEDYQVAIVGAAGAILANAALQSGVTDADEACAAFLQMVGETIEMNPKPVVGRA